jgi:hypothetical protein
LRRRAVARRSGVRLLSRALFPPRKASFPFQ